MITLEAGNELLKGYLLIRKLGEGSFGVVWLAEGPGKTQIALKFLDLGHESGLKEFQAISWIRNIHHPNLLPITGLWVLDQGGNVIDDDSLDLPQRHERRLFTIPATLVVAMVAGDMNLKDLLSHYQSQGQQGVPSDPLLTYIEDAARGLDFLNAPRHDVGGCRASSIQHRDIKPENILIVGDGAVICDFGVARTFHTESIATTQMIGSPAFMAPECIDGKISGRSSDQYSLALTYYYLRTGTYSVPASTRQSAIDCHVAGRLDMSLVSCAERIVLEKATSLDAQARYGSCREMVRALRQAVVDSTNKNGFDTPATARKPDSPAVLQLVQVGGCPSEAKGELTRNGTWRGKSQGTRLRIPIGLAATALVVTLSLSLRGLHAGFDPLSYQTMIARSERPETGAHQKATLDVEITTVSRTEPAPAREETRPLELAHVDDFWQAETPKISEVVVDVNVAESSPPVIEERSQAEIAVDELQRIGGIFKLDQSSLDLTGIRIDAGQLANLLFLSDLNDLILENTEIDDEGLEAITRHLPSLRSLDLSCTNVTRQGLRHLQRLQNLTDLDLTSCDIDDTCISVLSSLPNLRAVGLRSTRVSDASLYELSRSRNDIAMIQGSEFALISGQRVDLFKLP